MNTKIIYFISLNTLCIYLGYLMTLINNNLLLLYFSSLLKNITMPYLLNQITNNKSRINDKTIPHKTNTENVITNISFVSLTDTVSILICSYYDTSLYNSILLFIPSMFMFEVVFDFFHYWAHRTCHHKYLYWIHKQHHQDTYDLNIYSTFNHYPLDLLLTNILPMYLTSNIVPMTRLNFMTFMFYKTYIEISGHMGIILNSSSFPQCVWIPRLLNIDLYAEDHYEHHIKYNYNYSKRLNIWDKAFGTYYENENIKQKNRYSNTIINKIYGIGLLIVPIVISYYTCF